MEIPKVKDFMVKKLICLTPDEHVYSAIDVLIKNNISGAPVIEEKYEEKYIMGMLSEKDCLKILTHENFHNDHMVGIVKDYMTPKEKVITISPNMDIVEVATIFLENNFRRIPVVEDGILIGQVSRRDVLVASKFMRK